MNRCNNLKVKNFAFLLCLIFAPLSLMARLKHATRITSSVCFVNRRAKTMYRTVTLCLVPEAKVLVRCLWSDAADSRLFHSDATKRLIRRANAVSLSADTDRTGVDLLFDNKCKRRRASSILSIRSKNFSIKASDALNRAYKRKLWFIIVFHSLRVS